MESKTSRTIYIMSEAELVETAIDVLEEVSLIFTSVCEGSNGKMLTEACSDSLGWSSALVQQFDPSSPLNKMFLNLSSANKLWLYPLSLHTLTHTHTHTHTFTHQMWICSLTYKWWIWPIQLKNRPRPQQIPFRFPRKDILFSFIDNWYRDA